MSVDLMKINVAFASENGGVGEVLQAMRDARFDPICVSEHWDSQSLFVLVLNSRREDGASFPVPDLIISFDTSGKKYSECSSVI